MRRQRIPAALRRLVVARAGQCCEYCLLHEDDVPFVHEVDHVIAVKHGGPTTSDNLVLACLDCNRHKGSDLTTMDWTDGSIVPLFNPRTQKWADHFELDGAVILGLTVVGRVTITLLQLNVPMRHLQRQALIEAQRYPPK